jgi:hypothetical protein
MDGDGGGDETGTELGRSCSGAAGTQPLHAQVHVMWGSKPETFPSLKGKIAGVSH